MNIFSFDTETDGLYGPVWAIGAVVLNEEVGEEIARFEGQVEYTGENQWVWDSVVPYVDLPKFESARALRDAFWAFWMSHREEGCVCIADFGSPVESGLFRACVEDDLEARQWSGPYPLHEVGTMLLAAGIDPDVDRIVLSGLTGLKKHDPVADALASAVCWQKARQRIWMLVGLIGGYPDLDL
jgi:hypothetical protein